MKQLSLYETHTEKSKKKPIMTSKNFINAFDHINSDEIKPNEQSKNAEIDLEDKDESLTNNDIKTNHFYKNWFFASMNYFFQDAPKTLRYKNLYFSGDFDGLLDNFYDNIKEYIIDLYNLFIDIASSKIIYDINNTKTLGIEDFRNYNDRELQNFLAKIVINGKKIYSRVDGFVKRIGVLPEFMNNIIQLNNKHYYLINNDIYNIDFKLAVLSAIRFQNYENARDFRLKIMQWKSKG